MHGFINSTFLVTNIEEKKRFQNRRMKLLYIVFFCFFGVEGNIMCYECNSKTDKSCLLGPNWPGNKPIAMIACSTNKEGQVPNCKEHVEYFHRNNGSTDVSVYRGCSILSEPEYVNNCTRGMVDLEGNSFYAHSVCYCTGNLCNDGPCTTV